MSVGAQPIVPLRGDMGVLKDFRPNAAAWLSDNRLLIADLRYNNLQIFDLEGRRFRLFDAPSIKAPVQYVGMAKLSDKDLLLLGSHYHEKNHPRYLSSRSKLHKIHIDLESEELEQPEHNFSPLEALRQLRMWGATPLRPLEFCGLALDSERNLAWFGLARPTTDKQCLELLSCPLDKLMAGDKEIKVEEVDTGFELPLDEPSGRPTYLSDLALLDDGSLMLLLTADDIEGRRFCSNSLWRWDPTTKETTLIRKDLGMQNHATGLALRSLGNNSYRVALVCDNDSELTGLPATLIVIDEPIDLSASAPEPVKLSF